ncbi:DMT family transporter [Planctomicrobium sp. SH661]|uniref:DMT family transporter n=1 Tax=Planctomicrobium sp. SH661 TaxID=3448124 RepID=UPI003F5B5347
MPDDEPEFRPVAETRSVPEPMGPMSVFVAILTTVFWGGTAVSNQFAMDVIPPILLGGIRFVLAAVFMYVWCMLNGSPLLLKKGQWGMGWILGLLLFLQIGTFNIGSRWSTTSHASVLVNSYIFWVAGFEFLFFKTMMLNRVQWTGLILAGIGCGWVFLNTGTASKGAYDEPTIQGDLVLAVSGFLLAVKTLYTKHTVRHVSPGTIILWHDILGALMFFVCSVLLGEKVEATMTMTTWIATLYAGLIVSGYCFGANAALLRRHGASQVSVFSFLTPIIGVVLGVALRGDTLSLGLLIGGILVTIGIYLVNRVPADEPSA